MGQDVVFSPFSLKGYRLKNRLGVAAMTRMSSPGDGVPRKDVLEFLVRRAANGAAIVYTEGIVTDYESAQGYPRQARLLTQRQIDAWRPVVKSIKDAGAVAIAQLFHCGRVAWPEVNPAGRIIAPSAIAPKQKNPLTGKPYPVPDEMSRFDIEHVVQGFVESAKGAMAAGFDGVEIHGAHGYLITQFLSTYSNQRTDDYGGSVENRFRFARDIIRAVRPVVPGERLITFRISNWGIADMEVSLFQSREEWQEMIRLLSAEPVDAISVSTYEYDAKAFGTDKTMAGLAREVTKLPLMVCGKIYDRATCEDALRDADIALSAKSMLLNPNWVEDVRQGKKLPSHKSAEANVAYTETPLP
ncbi:MAG TPA: NADH:flavin oxidoreductase [Syntrophales bacterium]|nr:NADH:flavin oxidoreductase [Syntrophales bacterium]